jgi:hypothetical protein
MPAPARVPARIDVNPNPFGRTATVRLLDPTGLEKAVEIYDATGSIVRTLELSRGRATLDGRRLADAASALDPVRHEALDRGIGVLDLLEPLRELLRLTAKDQYRKALAAFRDRFFPARAARVAPGPLGS